MHVERPNTIRNVEGKHRTVGFELEYAGLDLSKTAEIIRKIFGGTIEEKNRYEFLISGTELGEFRVELDARILQKIASEKLGDKLGIEVDDSKIKTSIEDLLDKMAKSVVPIEVVMPPIPISSIEMLGELQQQLRSNKAEGTSTSLVHAFGMHINIECPDLETGTLLRYLRAFMLLYPWLLEELNIDFTRRISPFVDPFPSAYVEKVLNPSYDPDQEELIVDYLEYNATRNRPLDMMPVFALLDQDRVDDAMGGEKNNPRPTFHYRLPNSRIDDPDWSFTQEWNYWCAVEKLADNPDMIEKLGKLYLLRKSKTLVPFKKEWAETVRILLDLDE